MVAEQEGASPPPLILVADDQAAIRRLVARVLEAEGYRVLLAEDGAVALEAARQVGSALRLVITNLEMPRLSGNQLAQVLAGLDPELPVLHMTGTPGDLHTVLPSIPEERLLLKPFEPEELVQKVRALLRGDS